MHYRERSHVIYNQKIITYRARKTVSAILFEFTANISITFIFFTNEDSHGFSRVNPKIASSFSRLNLVSFSLFAGESCKESPARILREAKYSLAKRLTQSWD